MTPTCPLPRETARRGLPPSRAGPAVRSFDAPISLSVIEVCAPTFESEPSRRSVALGCTLPRGHPAYRARTGGMARHGRRSGETMRCILPGRTRAVAGLSCGRPRSRSRSSAARSPPVRGRVRATRTVAAGFRSVSGTPPRRGSACGSQRAAEPPIRDVEPTQRAVFGRVHVHRLPGPLIEDLYTHAEPEAGPGDPRGVRLVPHGLRREHLALRLDG